VGPVIGAAYFSEHRCELAPADVASAPNRPAVFLVWAAEGAPYLARTALLKRRLLRLLRERESPSRLLNLLGVARRIEYWECGSRLESGILFYSLAREHYPGQYLKIAKLRMPAYLKLVLSNEFPRTQVTTRLGGGRGLHFGPFRSRAGAEAFECQMLDLFQVRRCQENLEPRADHPGCIYGEMGMCLRPCQQVVNADEYASEVSRVRQFLATGGESLLDSIAAARDRSSEDLQFEEAARQHKRYERVQQVLALRDELVTEAGSLTGVAVAPAAMADSVTLWFMLEGVWTDPVHFPLMATGREMVSLDQRLREQVSKLQPPRAAMPDRQEHAALLSKWFYSSWCDGEWISFRNLGQIPYRKLVNAIARVHRESCARQ
jgi:excinuclease UvrABC nuclease subunit